MKLLYDNNITTITVITSNYHIRRGNILFKGVSMIMAETLKKSPIELLENAVWKKAGKTTEGKSVEGAALAYILNVKIELNQIFKTLVKYAGEIINYFLY